MRKTVLDLGSTSTYTFGKGKWEGDKYEGEWKKGEKHGQATYTTSSGRKYIGEWKDGLSHGQVTSPDGWRYVGELKNWKLTVLIQFTNLLDNLFMGLMSSVGKIQTCDVHTRDS